MLAVLLARSPPHTPLTTHTHTLSVRQAHLAAAVAPLRAQMAEVQRSGRHRREVVQSRADYGDDELERSVRRECEALVDELHPVYLGAHARQEGSERGAVEVM